MRHLMLLFCSLLCLSLPTTAAFNVTLPIVYGDSELGQLPVRVDGMTLTALSIPDLKKLLSGRLSESWWAELEAKNTDKNGFVSTELLFKLGVSAKLNQDTLVVALFISPETLAEQNISLANQYPLFIPSESGRFAWLNSFNARYDSIWSDSLQESATSIDWLSQLNIGGSNGLNVQMANYIDNDDVGTDFHRGEWKAFYDNPNAPMRISVGDVSTGESGHISSIAIGGLTIESRYADLQPNRDISPESSQQLFLLESADVDVYVNGERISGGRLEPGRYNLQKLMLGNGANDITVYVTYLSGKQETLVFTQFYNSRLLEKGLFDYSFSTGQPFNYGESGIEYNDMWVTTGFVEYGFLDWLTIGANGLSSDDGVVIGSVVTLSSDWGNITGRFSMSHIKEQETGNIVSIDYEHSVIGRGETQSPNLRLAIEYSDDFTSQPWAKNDYMNQFARYLGNYYWQINPQFDFTLSGRLTTFSELKNEFTASSLVNWRKNNLSIGVGVEYEESEQYSEADSRLLFTVDWSWYSSSDDYRIGLSYNAKDERSRFYLSNEGSEKVGDMGIRAEIETDPYQEKQNILASYTNNRYRSEVEITRNNSKSTDDDTYQASFRANTAIGIVDGDIGWGRASSGPFVVAGLHPSLANNTADLDVDQDGTATAQATSLIDGLYPLTQPYANNRIDYNMKDAPLGYDWGEGQITFMPGVATGHFMEIGSDASYTIKGILEFIDGEPLIYYQGKIDGEGQSLPIFTNKKGRFFVQGLIPGKYVIKIDGIKTLSPITVQVSKGQNNLIDVGTFHITCKGVCNE
ncbi:fimbria/pilus outer membrane usher protein [Aliivibrio sp. 1S128]|uniref:fimbria/pilus outer membrane usher protein n=1 Tax=Aliivibrio sp. 1S128 TaxID=1840085 RepID=UPI00080DE32E|nr:fimbria/pilus outer membrane usher protein [Aliivibrio sp. 1S128]OCH15096.1 pilus assembly protein PapC [Aliivibrio sp. 1S128]